MRLAPPRKAGPGLAEGRGLIENQKIKDEIVLLSDSIRNGAENHAERVALIFHDAEITYGKLAAGVEALAAGLRARGIKPGERIGLLLPNCPAFVGAYYAAGFVGAVAVPVNPTLKPLELEYIWRDADIRLVLTIPTLLPTAAEARKNLPGLREVLPIDPLQPPAEWNLFPDNSPDSETREIPLPEIKTDANDCAVIIYTSGTTGYPKGAMLSHRNLLRNIEQIQARLHFQPTDRFLGVLPLFHSFAATVCMNLTLAIGATVCLMENFTPSRVYEAMQKNRLSVIPAVPAIFNALLPFGADSPSEFSALRMLVSGGAPLPASTLAALETRFRVPVLEGDGPTECSPVTSVNPLEGPRKIGSVGPPLPGVEAAIFDDENKSLPPEAVGEIVVRGDNVMLGYLNQPDATAEAMTGGWYHTGDIGRMDADGYIYIMARKKDMIITSGLNVYPREIEEVLLTHPAVKDAAVIGLPDALRGEEVVAVVIRKPDVEISERDLMRYCRERLAPYKAPRRVIFREVLPYGSAGKVVKRLLKKEMELEIPDVSAR